MKLTKRDFLLLEKVFAEEIEGRIFQSKSKEYKRLEQEGMVEFVTLVLPGRFAVTVKGWALTHKGRMDYCANCPELPEEEE